MKKACLNVFFASVFMGIPLIIKSQTVGVNTDGSLPATLFHTKNTTAGEDNILRIENAIGNRETGINLLSSTTANANWKFYIPASSDALRLYNGSDFVTILQNGNVGIGTTDPRSRLALFSATSFNKPLFSLHPGDATTVNYSGFYHHDLLMGSYIPGNGFAHHYISFGYGGGSAGDGDGNPANGRKLHIGSANTADFNVASFVPQFTFTSSGRMGIGTTDPLATLDVNGTIKTNSKMDGLHHTMAVQNYAYSGDLHNTTGSLSGAGGWQNLYSDYEFISNLPDGTYMIVNSRVDTRIIYEVPYTFFLVHLQWYDGSSWVDIANTDWIQTTGTMYSAVANSWQQTCQPLMGTTNMIKFNQGNNRLRWRVRLYTGDQNPAWYGRGGNTTIALRAAIFGAGHDSFAPVRLHMIRID